MEKKLAQNLISASGQVGGEKNYWLQQLSGQLVKTRFPYDFANVDNHNRLDRQQIRFAVDGSLFQQLIKLSNNADSNLYVILLSLVNILVYKYSAEENEDIMILSPIYRQAIQGEYINTLLVLRNQINPQSTFKEFLTTVKQTAAAANKHANYPVEKLMYNDRLDIQETGRGFPLSDVILILENIHDREYINHIASNILFSFLRENHQLQVHIEYNSLLYRKETIEGYKSRFVDLLAQTLTDLTSPIAVLEILLPGEKDQLLDEFNATPTSVPREKTVSQLFEEQALKKTDSTAIVFEDSRLTYKELDCKSSALARLLKEKGLGSGCVAAILIESSLEMILAVIAVIKTGATYLPITPENPEARLGFMIMDSNSTFLLTREIYLKEFDFSYFKGVKLDLEDERITTRTGSGIKDNIPDSHHRSSEPVYMIYTSGTSGRPKAVLIKHENLVNYVSWFSHQARLTPADRTLLTSSFAYDLGYTALYPALLGGCQFHIVPGGANRDSRKLLEYIENHRISYLKLTPSLFSVLVNDDFFSPHTFQYLRLVVLGGEAINVKDVEKLLQLCPHIEVMNHYGPTEATVGCIVHRIDFQQFDQYEQTPVIGKPIYNMQVFILDRRRGLIPPGIPGEIYVSGAGIAAGYLNRPELSADRFLATEDTEVTEKNNQKFLQGSPGGAVFTKSTPPGRRRQNVYKTGDRGRWLSNGTVEFLGRIDQQGKIRGYRIEPGEIRDCLLQHQKIKEAVVTIEKNNSIYAFLVTASPLENSEMKEYLSKRVPNYMIPAYFVQMDRIPLTPNGKINYRELSRVSGLQKSQIDYVPPRNPVEIALVNIWETVLNIEKVGIRDSFFSIGGDSIKSIRIISKINKEFNLDFLIADLYEKETIENIARQIDEKQEIGAYTLGASQYDEAYRQALEQVERLKNSFLANPEQ